MRDSQLIKLREELAELKETLSYKDRRLSELETRLNAVDKHNSEPLETVMREPEAAISFIADYYGITYQQIISKSKRREYSQPRFVAYWILVNVYMMSTKSAGKLMGRDHSTVVCGKNRIWEMSKIYHKVRQDLSTIKAHCKSSNSLSTGYDIDG